MYTTVRCCLSGWTGRAIAIQGVLVDCFVFFVCFVSNLLIEEDLPMLSNYSDLILLFYFSFSYKELGKSDGEKTLQSSEFGLARL